MLREKGIRHDWKNILRIMSTQTIQTIELPTDKKNIHIRKPSKPIKQVAKKTLCRAKIRFSLFWFTSPIPFFS
jgi:hypothetical protein